MVNLFRRRLSTWKGRNLSLGGRITLLNAVLSNLPLYLFSFYRAPKKVIDVLTTIQKRFLWSGLTESEKMCWVNWDTICLLKFKGGLGVKNLFCIEIGRAHV